MFPELVPKKTRELFGPVIDKRSVLGEIKNKISSPSLITILGNNLYSELDFIALTSISFFSLGISSFIAFKCFLLVSVKN